MFGRSSRGRRQDAAERIFVTVQRGERIHCLGLRPLSFALLAASLPVSLALAGVAGVAVFYRDDLVAGLIAHEQAIVEGYEQELASQQAAFDAKRDASRREKDALDARLRELADRQAALEARDARVAALGSRLVGRDVTGSVTTVGRDGDKQATSGALSRLLRFGTPKAAPLPSEASAYAPTAAGTAAPASKPTPAPLDITPADDAAVSKRSDKRADLRVPDIASSLDRLESTQAATVAALNATARRRAGVYEAAFARLGLDPGRLHLPDAAGGQGGPMVPIPNDDLGALESQTARAERLARLAIHVPLASPADGTLEMTSPFGARPDPFTGRPMMHTGVDLREEPGAPIYATAPGRVTVASTAGGYGNMVEIDHGNGLRTRYGHLSRIDVAEDQWVEAGATIGHAGSTGRSTGTHLHYEVRVNGEPIDPVRYLEAGAKLAEAKL